MERTYKIYYNEKTFPTIRKYTKVKEEKLIETIKEMTEEKGINPLLINIYVKENKE